MTNYRALIETLAGGDVAFALVGGVAAVVHGSARLTQDVDVVYARDSANLSRLVACLAPHRPHPRGAPEQLPLRWGEATVRRHLNLTLTTTLGDLGLFGEIAGGGTYEDLVGHTVDVELFGHRIRCLDLPTLIRVRRIAGRPRDLEAVAELEALRDESAAVRPPGVVSVVGTDESEDGPMGRKPLGQAGVAATRSAIDCFHDERCRLRVERYQVRLRALALELSVTGQRERRRLAEGLHDHVGQSLAVARLQLEALRRTAISDERAGAVAGVIALLGDAIEETRRLTFELSPPLLDDLGLQAALESLATRMCSPHGISCRLDWDEKPLSLAPDAAAMAFSVVRELLHNVVKHAQANRVDITLVRAANHVRVEVSDDGVGFDLRHAAVPFDMCAGFGLFSCRERLLECGGSLDVASTSGQGTRVVIDVPLSIQHES